MEKYFYIVSRSVNECDPVDVYLAETFEEAVEVIKHAADRYCSNGSGWIRKVTKNMKTIEEWYLSRRNEVVGQYIHSKTIIAPIKKF